LLNAKAAEQFLALYKKQVDKLFLEELDVLDEPLAKPAVFSPQPEPAPQKEPPPPRGKNLRGKLPSRQRPSRSPRPASNCCVSCCSKLATWAPRTCISKRAWFRPSASTGGCRIWRIRRCPRRSAKPRCWRSWTTSSKPSLPRSTTWISAMTAANWDGSVPTI
jgi:hypothetical protein